MPHAPREVQDFVALPITLRAKAFPIDVQHYIYLKPHDPQVADEDAPRSLFLVNIPIATSEVHLRHLFATQLEAGRVERVDFAENATHCQSSAIVASTKSSRKRKRLTAEELEAGLDSYTLPPTLPGSVHASGSSAIVVFIDRTSRDLSLRAARKATKSSTTSPLIWGAGIEDKLPPTGLTRYAFHKTQQYPSRDKLMRTVNGYMAAYAQMEETRSRENARKRALPDDDGFVTVTRGSKGGAVRSEEAKELGEAMKAKQKDSALEDFYRFQMREKRKEKQGDMLRRFAEDKRRVEELRTRRGRVRPEK